MPRLTRSFFQRDVVTCARELIGCGLVWGGCRGIIVETEAYAASGDAACHTVSRPSARAFVDSHPAGSAYVYFNYGVHWMLNILTKSPEDGNGLILIRALRPTVGLEMMRARRSVKLKRPQPDHDRWLCSGPGKLASALAVTGEDHGRDLCDRRAETCLTGPLGPSLAVLAGPRIGISQARDFPWRFLADGDPHVSPARA